MADDVKGVKSRLELYEEIVVIELRVVVSVPADNTVDDICEYVKNHLFRYVSLRGEKQKWQRFEVLSVSGRMVGNDTESVCE
ncbi:MAG: hypothetical protein ACLQVJ_15370 [Syntrophobacteraceae bacterium]